MNNDGLKRAVLQIRKLIEEGRLVESDLPKLVENGLDPEIVNYYMLNKMIGKVQSS